MSEEDECDGNNSQGTPNASEGELHQLRRQSKIETYTYRDFTKVRLDNCDDTNEDNDGGGGGGAMRGTASSKTKKASAFRVTDKLDAMLRDPGKQHSVVDGSRCIHGTPSRPSLSSPPLSLPISFARNRRCRISNSPSLFSSAHKRNESTKNKTVNEMPQRAGDDPRLDAPRQIVEGAESRAVHGLCPPEVLRPRQLPQLRSLSQCLVSGASPRASLSVLFFVIMLQKTTTRPIVSLICLCMNPLPSAAPFSLIDIVFISSTPATKTTWNELRGFRRISSGVDIDSYYHEVRRHKQYENKKEDNDERTMDHSILPLPLTRHSSLLFFTCSFVSRSYSSGAFRSYALE